MTRARLQDRRPALALDFEHGGQRFRAHIGTYPDGRVAEIFLDAAKGNSAIDDLASDSAILISLLLQHGATLSEIAHALRRSPSGAPASLIGEAVRQLEAVEGPR